MKDNTKVKAAISKTAREIPIIAWAVEADGVIDPDDVSSSRSDARRLRTYMQQSGWAKRAHVRKIVMQVIPGR